MNISRLFYVARSLVRLKFLLKRVGFINFKRKEVDMWSVQGEIRHVMETEYEGVKGQKILIEIKRKFRDQNGVAKADLVPRTIYAESDWEPMKPHIGKQVMFPMDVQVNSKGTYISAASDGRKPVVMKEGSFKAA